MRDSIEGKKRKGGLELTATQSILPPWEVDSEKYN